MTARRVPVPGLRAGEQVLEGPQGHYLARVLRLRAGDAFTAFDPVAAREADAVVLSVRGDSLSVRLGAPRAGADRAGSRVTWVQAAPKGSHCDAIVRDATELGASRIIVVPTRRSVVRLTMPDARRQRWARIAVQAARQCGRTEAPSVEVAKTWMDALGCVGSDEARVCLATQAQDRIGSWLATAVLRATPLAFACGPEGGFDDDELAAARDAGWAVASLGPLTLRVETVAAAVLGAVSVLAQREGQCERG